MEGCNPDTLARAAKTGTGDDPTYRAEETEEPETQAHVEATKQISKYSAGRRGPAATQRASPTSAGSRGPAAMRGSAQLGRSEGAPTEREEKADVAP